ncbi:MAG: hypothetical protein ACHQAY_08085 [Hyphomicrobiales bacterium]
MTDIGKREPSLGAPAERAVPTFFPPPPAEPAPAHSSGVPLSERGGLDQLSRLEEKLARIEEKFARSEALLLRVETTFQDALNKFGGLARTADVNALEGRVRRLPGVLSVFTVGLLAALIGAAAVLALQKYGITGFLPPR